MPGASVSTYPFDQWVIPFQLVAYAIVTSLSNPSTGSIQVAVPVMLTFKVEVSACIYRLL